jgi:hypothetical protein
VSRTFYARGQTGQQLLLGAYQALEKEVRSGKVRMYTRHEMLDVVIVDGRARGIVTRNLVTGPDRVAWAADAVVLATGGYSNVFFLSTNAKGCNVTAIWRAHSERRRFREPVLHADPPDVHPAQSGVPVEAHADERVAAQRRPDLGTRRSRATSAAQRDPGRGARLLPRALLSQLRQPRAARHLVAAGQGGRR